ncbi:hypothetical protein BTVI_98539 [Pitangus sulphuratus]|nr:hypothetical protein BTVI_98539 [Pitangus sulphuratus]
MAGPRALLRHFPLLLPQNRRGTAYEGFVTAQRLHSCPDLVSFMVELKTVLEIALKNTPDLHVPRPPEYYSCLVRDLETLGWNKVAYVDTGLTTVKLKAEDSRGRQHLITLKLNAKVFVVMRDRLLVLFKPRLAFKLARQNLDVECGFGELGG